MEIVAELGVGGMATVHLARMRGRLVAVKVLHPAYASDPEIATMFLDEARLGARLRHPNIVSTLDVITDGDRVAMVMEYVDGVTVGRLVATGISPAAACAIVHDALLGLHAAHEAVGDDGEPLGVIHRDVSPQNIMVAKDGAARVLDFGIAKARHRLALPTGDGVVKGKIHYMAPEQLFGERAIDRRADVYAAGVVLWELLARRPLFVGDSEAVAGAIDAGVIPPPSLRSERISPALDDVVLRALARDADDRFPTAAAMAAALRRITQGAS